MILIDRKSYLMIFLALVTLLNLGTIRKDEDPIAKAQTDPISLKQKMEEMKDGVKGAPTPSFRYYEKEDFLTRTPMGVGIEEAPLGKPARDSELEAVSEVDTEADLWHEPAEGDEAKEDSSAAGQAPDETPSAEEKADEEDDWWMEEPA